MVNQVNSKHFELAKKITGKFKNLQIVEAIGLGGSLSTDSTDRFSDIDLYIYTNETIPIETRHKIIKNLGYSRKEINLQFWDTGDQWFDAETGIEVDVIYWDKPWIENMIERVVVNHLASVGYSTSFWHTVLNTKILFDRDNWLGFLKEKCEMPFPENLKKAIIAKNHPILRNVIPAYYFQIKKAIDRNDLISINHRVAALLASYFDVLFAINHLTNPGEKKVLKLALENCSKIPNGFKNQVVRILQSTGFADETLLTKLDFLIDGLDNLLRNEGIDPDNTLSLNN